MCFDQRQPPPTHRFSCNTFKTMQLHTNVSLSVSVCVCNGISNSGLTLTFTMRFHSQENTFANQIKFTKILREIRYYCYLFMGYIHTLRLLGIGREHKSSFWFVLQLQCYVKNCKSYLLQGNSKINQVVSSLQTATHALFCRPHREKRTMHCTHRNLKESAACAAFIALFRTYKVV